MAGFWAQLHLPVALNEPLPSLGYLEGGPEISTILEPSWGGEGGVLHNIMKMFQDVGIHLSHVTSLKRPAGVILPFHR